MSDGQSWANATECATLGSFVFWTGDKPDEKDQIDAESPEQVARFAGHRFLCRHPDHRGDLPTVHVLHGTEHTEHRFTAASRLVALD